MNTSRLCRPLLVVASLAVLTFSSLAGAEPPMRAARFGYATGTVSFSPAGEGDWVRAMVNRPLTRGDRLWVEAGARAEVQLGGASIRLGSSTSVTLLNVDDRMTQLQLSEGSLRIRVRRMGPGEAIEIDTPNLAFYISRPGEYRINVDANGDSTAVRVISGRAEAYGDRASYALGTQQGYRFYGTGLSDYDRLAVAAWRDDDLDRWSYERERRYANSASARYVSLDVVGYEDLDSYGRWQRDPEYGYVWTPTRVSAGWAPFRDGHWSWVDPWGWTWVDDAPWGYAVSHYGRWANRSGTWVWVPGPQRERAVYAPAQVAFVGNFGGGASVSIAIGGLIGWFALAPREVYQPSYPVSRGYFERVNRSNAVVAPTTIVNVYNTTIVNNTTYVNREGYANQRVRGGVVAVPAQAFTQSQPVARASTQASSEQAAKGQVSHAAPVAPEKQSVQGGAPAASAQPTHRERRVVARTAPPPPPPAFAAQQQQLAAKPGRPIDEAQRRELKPAAAAPAPVVSVVPTAKAPAAAPPATAPAARSPEQRRSESAKADAGRPEGQRGEGRRTDAAKAEAPKGDAAKADAAKADAAKADTAKADAAKADAAKADAAKAEASRKDERKADFAKRDRERDDARKADAAKVDAAKGDAMKAEAAKAAAARNEAARAEAAKADAAKAEAVKAEAARIDAAKAAAAKADASRAEAAKAEAAKAEAMKAEAAKAAAARNDAARAEAAKADAARAEAAKAAAARADAAKAEAARAEAAKAQAAQAEAAKAQAAQAAAAKAQAAQAEAAKAQAAQAAAAKAQAAQAEAAKAQAAQAAAAKAQAAQAEAAKAQAAAKATGAAGAAVKGDLTDAEKAARRAARKARGEKEDEDKK